MDGWGLVALVAGVSLVVIAIPLVFVLRGLSQVAQRTAALAEALQQTQEATAGAARLDDAASTLERSGGS